MWRFVREYRFSIIVVMLAVYAAFYIGFRWLLPATPGRGAMAFERIDVGMKRGDVEEMIGKPKRYMDAETGLWCLTTV